MPRWLPLLTLASCFYVTAEERRERFDLDGDGIPRPEDCDDDDAAVGVIRWFTDLDHDGYGDPAQGTDSCEVPPGMVRDDSDCDDADPERHPDAVERCDGFDDDCDGTADDGAEVPTWYEDTDGDQQGDAARPLSACVQPAGAVANADDCDDTDPDVKLDGVEVACNGVDDDCDGDVDLDDPDVDPLDWTWYPDTDHDTWGDDAGPTVEDCAAPADHADRGGDCADGDPFVNPGAVEECNGWDDDCDEVIDPYGSVGATEYYADGDGDGAGDPTASVFACAQPADTVPAAGAALDCDDADACKHPGAQEVCNGLDDDCDVLNVDEGCVPVDTGDPGGAPCY